MTVDDAPAPATTLQAVAVRKIIHVDMDALLRPWSGAITPNCVGGRWR
jgi:hypothetical protein